MSWTAAPPALQHRTSTSWQVRACSSRTPSCSKPSAARPGTRSSAGGILTRLERGKNLDDTCCCCITHALSSPANSPHVCCRNFINHFRDNPEGVSWTALPEFFRKQGFFATGAGKVYHPNHPPDFDQNRSWSETWPGSFGACPCGGSGWPPGGQASCEGLRNTSCQDDAIVRTITEQLHRAASGSLGADGFFIAAGLHKPHLPFYAPPEFYDLYPEPPAPVPLHVPEAMPYAAWHSCLSSSANPADYSNWGNFTDIPNEMSLREPMPPAIAARLRRGYAASVSYTDANVGAILAAAEPLRDSTIVVLIGDHGWSLGEGNLWCKMTNSENGVRTPLIFRAPGLQPGGPNDALHRTSHLAVRKENIQRRLTFVLAFKEVDLKHDQRPRQARDKHGEVQNKKKGVFSVFLALHCRRLLISTARSRMQSGS